MKAAVPLLMIILLARRSAAFLSCPSQPLSAFTRANEHHCAAALMRNTENISAKRNDDEEETADSNKIMGVFKKSPGTIIIVPFVALFGFDLIGECIVFGWSKKVHSQRFVITLF